MMKLVTNLVFVFLIMGACGSNIFAVENKVSSSKMSNTTQSQKSSDNKQQLFAEPPKLKNDDLAIFLEDKYKILKIRKFNELELSEDCFVNNKPKCLAYEFAQIKPKKLEIKYEGFNNLAAIHCSSVSGKNLIAIDKNNNQFNYCHFSDGSLVNSWSMYYKHFPNKNIK